MGVKEHEELNAECLLEHNRLRALHGCAPLQLDMELADKARLNAENLIEKDILEHNQSNDYGENLAVRICQEKALLTGKQATLMWYSEIANYDFNLENQLVCGHFSQIVWKSTTHAGFGCARKPDGRKVIIVGIYMPPGNFKYEWRANVPPPISGYRYIPSKDDIFGFSNTISETPTEYEVNDSGANETVMQLPREKSIRLSTNNTSVNPLIKIVVQSFPGQNEAGPCISQHTELVQLIPNDLVQPNKAVHVHETFHIDQNDSDSANSILHVHTWYDLISGKEIQAIDNSEISKVLSDPHNQLEAFRIEVLHTHNRYRKIHGVEKLRKNRQLDRLAQKWANCLRDINKSSYSDWKYHGMPLGEIISYRIAQNQQILGEELVSKWYQESQSYDYTREPESAKFHGHFTQLVWKNSMELGVGFIPSNEPNMAFVVCFYYPPGNVKGQFMANVFPCNAAKELEI